MTCLKRPENFLSGAKWAADKHPHYKVDVLLRYDDDLALAQSPKTLAHKSNSENQRAQ